MPNNHHIDFEREQRLGFPEVIFGERKDEATLLDITHRVLERTGRVMITRLQPGKFDTLDKQFHPAFYDPSSQVCIIGELPRKIYIERGAAVLSGGTSDEFIVNEAYYTLRFFGIGVERFQDVGAAGIHRLLRHEEAIRTYKTLIVVAGFEGALPTVAGGLFPQPIIAVPASVGYGVAAGGRAALDSMLSSCANGILVTNIDNGYGAALAAYRMLRTLNGTPLPLPSEMP